MGFWEDLMRVIRIDVYFDHKQINWPYPDSITSNPGFAPVNRRGFIKSNWKRGSCNLTRSRPNYHDPSQWSPCNHDPTLSTD
jgi:hypothetical protein